MKKLKSFLLVLMPAILTMLSVICFTSIFSITLIKGWIVAILLACSLSFMVIMFNLACKELTRFASIIYSIVGVLAMVCVCFRVYSLVYTISVVAIVLTCLYFLVKLLYNIKPIEKVDA